MRKLLRANWNRLWKNSMFWISMASMLAFGVLVISEALEGNSSNPADVRTSPDALLMGGTVLAGFISAIFSAFYIGTDYSDGTIRNKLTLGHSRTAIYFANFLVCLLAAWMINAIYWIVILAAGSLLIGSFAASAGVVIKLLLFGLIPVIALNALYMLLEMLISNKTIAVTVLILFSFGLISAQLIMTDRLSSPEYYEAYSWTDDDGNEHEEPRHKNSSYPTGLKRQFYELMCDVLPAGQTSQMSTMLMESAETGTHTTENYADLWKFTGYSLLIIFISSTAGVILFRRKDIK